MLKLSVLKSSSRFCTWMGQIATYIFFPFCSHVRLLLKSPALSAHQSCVGEMCSCLTAVTNSILALQGTETSLGLFKSLVLQQKTKKGRTIPL